MAKLKNVIAKEIDLVRSRRVDTSSIRTACLVLGPQRNLTTLTAALLFLHPRCQVLNHAGVRVLGDRRLDFVSDYSPSRFERFLRYAVHISRELRRSRRGGSITSSHAFADHEPMRRAFEESGLGLVRERIETLFWKESVRNTFILRSSGVDLVELVNREPRLRFLMPVRNPLDCAASNLARKWGPRVWDRVPGSMEDSVRFVLDDLAWIRQRELENSDHFLHFFEYDLDAATLDRIAEFLSIESLPEWHERALSAARIHTHYQHPPALWDLYRREVDRLFAGDAEFRQALLRFADASAGAETALCEQAVRCA